MIPVAVFALPVRVLQGGRSAPGTKVLFLVGSSCSGVPASAVAP